MMPTHTRGRAYKYSITMQMFRKLISAPSYIHFELDNLPKISEFRNGLIAFNFLILLNNLQVQEGPMLIYIL